MLRSVYWTRACQSHTDLSEGTYSKLWFIIKHLPSLFKVQQWWRNTTEKLKFWMHKKTWITETLMSYSRPEGWFLSFYLVNIMLLYVQESFLRVSDCKEKSNFWVRIIKLSNKSQTNIEDVVVDRSDGDAWKAQPPVADDWSTDVCLWINEHTSLCLMHSATLIRLMTETHKKEHFLFRLPIMHHCIVKSTIVKHPLCLSPIVSVDMWWNKDIRDNNGRSGSSSVLWSELKEIKLDGQDESLITAKVVLDRSLTADQLTWDKSAHKTPRPRHRAKLERQQTVLIKNSPV